MSGHLSVVLSRSSPEPQGIVLVFPAKVHGTRLGTTHSAYRINKSAVGPLTCNG
jgi:hypothetical protein